MTITLHWWMVPLAIIIVGFIIAQTHKDQGGYMPDLFPGLVMVIAIAVAVAICVGHWL